MTRLPSLKLGMKVLRILYIDDNEDDLELTRLLLQRQGGDLVIDLARSAEEALARLHEEDYDCVICDYMMPKTDGMQLLQDLRKEGNSVPFIFYTCFYDEDVAARALRNGADDVLFKEATPSHFEKLYRSIIEVTASHEPRNAGEADPDT